jgi:pyridoxal phosphate enzyme (YggS family)
MNDGVAGRIAAVRERIARACARAGRVPDEVALVGVSKTHGPEAVAAAHAAGLRDFGENRVQEAAPKIEALRARGISPAWHLVGHLQTNKVTVALACFDILHGVDSVRLAEAISRRATRPVKLLLEVNVAGESSKFGLAPEETPAAAGAVARLPNIDLLGLMTVAPQAAEPEDVRGVFRRLRALRDALGLRELSMGMTDDFEVAVEEGSTLVRVGRAIFGERVTPARMAG